jgi:hypothetical protein
VKVLAMNVEQISWPEILNSFGPKIDHRLVSGVVTTEDTVRYYFFEELLAAGLQPDQMVLERPHPYPRLRGKEIDLSVLVSPTWDLEVKCHRPIPGGSNLPLTQLRGAIVADLYELALSDAQHRHLLYIAESTVAPHMLRNLAWLLDTDPGTVLHVDGAFLATQNATLRGTVLAKLGFEPDDVEFEAWNVAAWTGEKAAAWIFQVQAC